MHGNSSQPRQNSQYRLRARANEVTYRRVAKRTRGAFVWNAVTDQKFQIICDVFLYILHSRYFHTAVRDEMEPGNSGGRTRGRECTPQHRPKGKAQMVGRAPCGMPHVLALSSQPLHMFARHHEISKNICGSKIGGVRACTGSTFGLVFADLSTRQACPVL